MGRVYIRQPVSVRIAALTSPEPNTGCWLWAGQVDDHGYAVLKMPRGPGRSGAPRRVARLVLEPIAPSLCACHRCDNPLCVNPDHLYRGTRADNMHDMARRGRSTRGERSKAAKMSEDGVRWLREQYEGGRTQADLARELGLDQSTVSKAITGDNWGHVS